jgi:hypothetical protein
VVLGRAVRVRGVCRANDNSQAVNVRETSKREQHRIQSSIDGRATRSESVRLTAQVLGRVVQDQVDELVEALEGAHNCAGRIAGSCM